MACVGLVLFAVSGTHWRSWESILADKGGTTIAILYNHRKDFYSKTFGLTVRWKLMSKIKPMKLKQKKSN